jgi:hypothetical protein
MEEFEGGEMVAISQGGGQHTFYAAQYSKTMAK